MLLYIFFVEMASLANFLVDKILANNIYSEVVALLAKVKSFTELFIFTLFYY